MNIYLGMDNSYSTESRCIFLFMLYFSDIVIKLSWVQVIEYTNILGTSDRVHKYFRYKWSTKNIVKIELTFDW